MDKRISKIEKLTSVQLHQAELTDFSSREMLYDYLTSRLSKDDMKKMDQKQKSAPFLVQELKNMQAARDYMHSLSHLEVPAAVLAKIDQPEKKTILSRENYNLESMSESFKQGLTAFAIVVAVLLLTVSVPWHRVRELQLFQSASQVIVATVDKRITSTDLQDIEKNEQGDFLDDTNEEAAAKVPAVVGRGKKEVVAKAPTAQVEAPPAAVAPPSLRPQAPSAESSAVAAANSPENSSAAPTESGFIYRGELKITNLDVNSQRITDKILELGGRKAGQVELGWKRDDKTLYYHFTIPEAKYSELNEFLMLYGKPQITKDKHPRVMPEGILRLILTVDEENQ